MDLFIFIGCGFLTLAIILYLRNHILIHIPRRKRFNWDRIYKRTDQKDYGVFNPCMTDKAVVDELCSYFLGDNWYDSSGATHREQVNTAIVCAIEQQYKGAKINKAQITKKLKEEDIF